MRRWLLAGAVALVVLLAAGAVAAYLVLRGADDVRGSSTEEFVVTDVPDPPRRPVPTPDAVDDIVSWPTYGYSSTRVRISPYDHRPPFRQRWLFRGRDLLEFPPSIAYGLLFVTNNDGVTFAVDADTGKAVWQHAAGRCVASTPAVAGELVIQSFLNRPPCNSDASPFDLDGRVIAFDARTGKVRWQTELGPTESSPLVVGGRVLVGDWRGDVVALDVDSGRRVWRYRTGGRVKGAVSASGNRAYVGSYDGRMYAFNARTGALQWSASSQERLGTNGRFYSTPALAYGRVYVGSTDGKVYAYGAASGQLLWATSTGGFVYSSPAVWNQTVYAGSYSSRLFALDAATGATRWTFAANGPISGAPTVMDGLIWFATLERRTYVLDARTGRQVWTFPDGEYTPLVADAERAYLVGYARIYALDPRR
ncbi:MAG: PQQ-binding-like beta-propeller repeat protein [Gaiella sp.]